MAAADVAAQAPDADGKSAKRFPDAGCVPTPDQGLSFW